MSAILSADDLNDFISPGVACIKPAKPLTPFAETAGEVEIQVDAQGNPLAISEIDQKHNQLQPAQISLADCLACSGCITSAEEVLVAQHSHQQVRAALFQPETVYVASISHQARASLAQAWQCSVEAADATLMALFSEQLGFTYVVGTAVGRKVSLVYEAQSQDTASPRLSSICPGWVLYAEKTHPEAIAHMSTVKSAQQITGTILKRVVSKEKAIDSTNVYHLTVMPCFDKKLEAARADNAADVDGVITPKELIMMLDEMNISVKLSTGAPQYDKYSPPQFPQWSWTSDIGSVSGGYAVNYLRAKQAELESEPNYERENFSIESIEGKNPDVYELRLIYNGDKVASAAVVNGFRNIQNLVRKLKGPKKVNPLAARRRARLKKDEPTQPTADPTQCDYVEIMACPAGCINGGGQVQAPEGTSSKEWIDETTQLYGHIPKFDAVSHASDVKQYFSDFCHDYGVNADQVVNTKFTPVEKEEPALGTKW
ncbi:cytosolic Fe-S cluster assembly factor Nar1p [Diutina rugosa]